MASLLDLWHTLNERWRPDNKTLSLESDRIMPSFKVNGDDIRDSTASAVLGWWLLKRLVAEPRFEMDGTDARVIVWNDEYTVREQFLLEDMLSTLVAAANYLASRGIFPDTGEPK